MKTFVYTAAFVVFASAASACPWASKSYRATIEPSIDFNFIFDETCASVQAQKSGKEVKTVPLTLIDRSKADHGWYFEYDLFQFLFRFDGKQADAKQGGARRPMRLRER